MSDNVLVGVRVRPLLSRELNEGKKPFWKTSDKSIVQIDIDSQKEIGTFTYDRVFDDTIGNEELYEEVAAPLVESAFEGFNGTIFAYGQTASGKTYTMTGSQDDLGIIPMSFQKIFQNIENCPNREFLLRASYMEIYQENITDLLTGNKLSGLREDSSGNVYVPDLKEICVSDETALLRLMAGGDKKRKVAETNMNEKSSRSHSIFRLILESRERGEVNSESAVAVSHLNMVDLAGSENASQTGATGERLKEGSSINRSLFMLGRVISQLSDGESFINFRDSKLTRILQNSLGGNARTAIVCTVTVANREQTLSTLRFASRAKSIKNKPVMNEVVSDTALLKRYANEIKKLKCELDSALKTDKALEVEEVKEKLDEQEKRNQDLQKKIASLSEMIVVSSMPDEPKAKLKKKARRETWAAPLILKHRGSMIPTSSSGLNLAVPDYDFLRQPIKEITKTKTPSKRVNFEGIPKPAYDFDLEQPGHSSRILSTVSEECSEELSNASKYSENLSDSFRSIEFRSPSDVTAFNLDASTISLPDETCFLAPFNVSTRRSRKKKKVEFTPEKEFCDAVCQTDEALLPQPLLLGTPKKSIPSSPSSLATPVCTPKHSPTIKLFDTPKDVLRARYRGLRDELDRKEEWLENYQDEIVHLTEFQKNEIQLLDESFRGKIDIDNLEKVEELSYQIVSLEKSLNDSEELYMETNKALSIKSEELLYVSEQNHVLNEKLVKLEEVDSTYTELKKDKLVVDQHLFEYRERCTHLQNERSDFDMMTELSLAKHQQLENDLRKSLQEAWSENEIYKSKDRKGSGISTEEPYKSNDKEIEKMKDELERVRERIAEVEALNEELKEDIATMKLTEESLFKKPLIPVFNMDDSPDFDASLPNWQSTKLNQSKSFFPKTPTLNHSRSFFPKTPMSNFNHSSISIKLSETLHALEESILATSPDEGGLDSNDLMEIKHKLLLLQDFVIHSTEKEIAAEMEHIEHVIKSDYLEEMFVWNMIESFTIESRLNDIKVDDRNSAFIKAEVESGVDKVQERLELEYREKSIKDNENMMGNGRSIINQSLMNETMDCMGTLPYDDTKVFNGNSKGLSLADELQMASLDVTVDESYLPFNESNAECSNALSNKQISEIAYDEKKYIDEIEALQTIIKSLEERIAEFSVKINENVVMESNRVSQSEIQLGNKLALEVELLKEQMNILKDENAELMVKLNRISNEGSLDASFHSVGENEDVTEVVLKSLARNIITENRPKTETSFHSISTPTEANEEAFEFALPGDIDLSVSLKLKQYREEIATLQETLKYQDGLIYSLESKISDMDNLRIKEEEIEALITDMECKEEKLENWESILVNREQKILDSEVKMGANKEQDALNSENSTASKKVIKRSSILDMSNMCDDSVFGSRFIEDADLSVNIKETSFEDIKSALIAKEEKSHEVLKATEEELSELKCELESKNLKIKQLEEELLSYESLREGVMLNTDDETDSVNVVVTSDTKDSVSSCVEEVSVELLLLKSANAALQNEIIEYKKDLVDLSVLKQMNEELASEKVVRESEIERLLKEVSCLIEKLALDKVEMEEIQGGYNLLSISNGQYKQEIEKHIGEVNELKETINDQKKCYSSNQELLQQEKVSVFEHAVEIERLNVSCNDLKAKYEMEKQEYVKDLERQKMEYENKNNSAEFVQLKEIQSAIKSSGIDDLSAIMSFFDEYAKLKDKICTKEMQINVLIDQGRNLECEIEKMKQNYKVSIDELERKADSLENELEKREEDICSINKAILDKESQCHDQGILIVNLRNKIAMGSGVLHNRQVVEKQLNELSESLYCVTEESGRKDKECTNLKEKLTSLESILESKNMKIVKEMKESEYEKERLISLLNTRDEDLFETKANLDLTVQELKRNRSKLQSFEKRHDDLVKNQHDKEECSLQKFDSFRTESDDMIEYNEKVFDRIKGEMQRDLDDLQLKYQSAISKSVSDSESLKNTAEHIQKCVSDYNILKAEYDLIERKLLSNGETIERLEKDLGEKDQIIESKEFDIARISTLLKELENEHEKCSLVRNGGGCEANDILSGGSNDEDVKPANVSNYSTEKCMTLQDFEERITNIEEDCQLELDKVNAKFEKIVSENEKHVNNFEAFLVQHKNCITQQEFNEKENDMKENYEAKINSLHSEMRKGIAGFEAFMLCHERCISIKDSNDREQIVKDKCQLEVESLKSELKKLIVENQEIEVNIAASKVHNEESIPIEESDNKQKTIKDDSQFEVDILKLQAEMDEITSNFEAFRSHHVNCTSVHDSSEEQKIIKDKYQLEVENLTSEIERLMSEKEGIAANLDAFKLQHKECIQTSDDEQNTIKDDRHAEVENVRLQLEKLTAEKKEIQATLDSIKSQDEDCTSILASGDEQNSIKDDYQAEVQIVKPQLEKLTAEKIEIEANLDTFNTQHEDYISIEVSGDEKSTIKDDCKAEVENVKLQLEKLTAEKMEIEATLNTFKSQHEDCVSLHDSNDKEISINEKSQIEVNIAKSQLETFTLEKEKVAAEFEAFKIVHEDCISNKVSSDTKQIVKDSQLEVEGLQLDLEKLTVEKQEILENFEAFKDQNEDFIIIQKSEDKQEAMTGNSQLEVELVELQAKTKEISTNFEAFKNLHNHCIFIHDSSDKHEIITNDSQMERVTIEKEEIEINFEAFEVRHKDSVTIKESDDKLTTVKDCSLFEAEIVQLQAEKDQMVVNFEAFKNLHNDCISSQDSCNKQQTTNDKWQLDVETLKSQLERFTTENEEIVRNFEAFKVPHGDCISIQESDDKQKTVEDNCQMEVEILKAQLEKYTVEKVEIAANFESLKNQHEDCISTQDSDELQKTIKENCQVEVDIVKSQLEKLCIENEKIAEDFEAFKNLHVNCVSDQESNDQQQIINDNCQKEVGIINSQLEQLSIENEKIVSNLKLKELLCEELTSRNGIIIVELAEMKKNIIEREKVSAELEMFRNDHVTCFSPEKLNEMQSEIDKCKNEIIDKSVICKNLGASNENLAEEFSTFKNEHNDCASIKQSLDVASNQITLYESQNDERETIYQKVIEENEMLREETESCISKKDASDLRALLVEKDQELVVKWDLYHKMVDEHEAKLKEFESLKIEHDGCIVLQMENSEENSKMLSVIEKYESDMSQKEASYQIIVKDNSDLKKEILKLESILAEHEDCAANREFSITEISKLNSVIHKYEAEINEKGRELINIKEEYFQLKEELVEKDDKLKRLSEKPDTGEEVELIRKEKETLEVELRNCKVSLSKNVSSLSNANKKIKDLELDVENIKIAMSVCQLGKHDLHKELKDKKIAILNLESIANDHKTCRDEKDKLVVEMKLLSEKLTTRTEELENLIKEFDERMEYYKEYAIDVNNDFKEMKGKIQTLEHEKTVLEVAQTSMLQASNNSTLVSKSSKLDAANVSGLLDSTYFHSIINEKESLTQKLEKCALSLSEKTQSIIDEKGIVKRLFSELGDIRDIHKETQHNMGKLKKELHKKDSFILDLESRLKDTSETENRDKPTPEVKELEEKLETLKEEHGNLIKEFDERMECYHDLEGDYNKDVGEMKGTIRKLEHENTLLLEETHCAQSSLLSMSTGGVKVESNLSKHETELQTSESNILRLRKDFSDLNMKVSKLEEERQMLVLNYKKMESDLKEARSNLIQVKVSSDDVIKALNKKLSDFEEEKLKSVQMDQKEKLGSDLDTPGYCKKLRDENFTLIRDNNILKMKIEALDSPAAKELKSTKHELDVMHAKNQQLKQELRRLQECRGSEMSFFEVAHAKKPAPKPVVDEQHSLQYGSQVVLEVQLMGLERVNYELNKEKEELVQQDKVSKSHIDHYKGVAQKWKNKAREEEECNEKLQKKNDRITSAAEDLKLKYMQRKEEVLRLKTELEERVDSGASEWQVRKDVKHESFSSESSSSAATLPLSTNSASPRKDKSRGFTDKYPCPEKENKEKENWCDPADKYRGPRRDRTDDDNCKTQ